MTKDLITITLERDKAEYMASSFANDLKWLGVTSGIDLGNCYIDFIEQVRKQRGNKKTQGVSPQPPQPIDMKTFRLHLKEYLKERVRNSDRGITVWDCRGKIAFRFRSAKGLTDRSFVTKNFYWENKEDVAKVWEKFKRILRNYPYSFIGTSISKPVSQIPYKFKNNWEHSFAIYNLEQMVKLSLKKTDE